MTALLRKFIYIHNSSQDTFQHKCRANLRILQCLLCPKLFKNPIKLNCSCLIHSVITLDKLVPSTLIYFYVQKHL